MTSFQSRWDNPCRRCGDMMCALSILCIRTAYRWIPGYAKRIGGMALSCFTRVPLACARPPGSARLSLVQGQYPKTINWFRYFPGYQKKHYGYVVISLIMIGTIAFSAHRAWFPGNRVLGAAPGFSSPPGWLYCRWLVLHQSIFNERDTEITWQVLCRSDKSGFSWSASVHGKACFEANDSGPLCQQQAFQVRDGALQIVDSVFLWRTTGCSLHKHDVKIFRFPPRDFLMRCCSG